MGLDILFLLLPVAALSGWIIGRRTRSSPDDISGRPCVSSDYFKGLNYLLDEQQDKAIEVFVQMLEADSDTVEVHFALGNLFLRRGEVDRAIRIHQNLIARPTLNRSQRNQALFELGRDYMRAGLLDRAESLFLELTEDNQYGEAALRQLLDLFQQEKEWTRAIEVAQRLSGRGSRSIGPMIAHFFCELAEEAIAQGDISSAERMIKRALSEDKNSARASLIEGQLHLDSGAPKLAVRAFQRIEQQDPDYLPEVIEPMEASYAALGRPDEMTDYLRRLLEKHGGISTMLAFAEHLRRRTGDSAAIDFMTDFLRRRPSVRGMARLVELKSASSEPPAREDLQLLGEITGRLLHGKPVYKCRRCGFTCRTLHWQCPSCKEWNTVKPIHGIEGE